jgi:hypothetical protein
MQLMRGGGVVGVIWRDGFYFRSVVLQVSSLGSAAVLEGFGVSAVLTDV